MCSSDLRRAGLYRRCLRVVRGRGTRCQEALVAQVGLGSHVLAAALEDVLLGHMRVLGQGGARNLDPCRLQLARNVAIKSLFNDAVRQTLAEIAGVEGQLQHEMHDAADIGTEERHLADGNVLLGNVERARNGVADPRLLLVGELSRGR